MLVWDQGSFKLWNVIIWISCVSFVSVVCYSDMVGSGNKHQSSNNKDGPCSISILKQREKDKNTLFKWCVPVQFTFNSIIILPETVHSTLYIARMFWWICFLLYSCYYQSVNEAWQIQLPARGKQRPCGKKYRQLDARLLTGKNNRPIDSQILSSMWTLPLIRWFGSFQDWSDNVDCIIRHCGLSDWTWFSDSYFWYFYYYYVLIYAVTYS